MLKMPPKGPTTSQHHPLRDEASNTHASGGHLRSGSWVGTMIQKLRAVARSSKEQEFRSQNPCYNCL